MHPEILAGAAASRRRARRSDASGRPLPFDRRSRAAPAPQRHAHREVLPAPVEGRAAQAVPRAHRRSGEELEVQRRRHRGTSASGRTTCARTKTASSATSTDDAPWYVVPADDKQNARLIVSQVVLDTMKSLKMRYPSPDAARLKELQRILERVGLIPIQPTRAPAHLACRSHRRSARDRGARCPRTSGRQPQIQRCGRRS